MPVSHGSGNLGAGRRLHRTDAVAKDTGAAYRHQRLGLKIVRMFLCVLVGKIFSKQCPARNKKNGSRQKGNQDCISYIRNFGVQAKFHGGETFHRGSRENTVGKKQSCISKARSVGQDDVNLVRRHPVIVSARNSTQHPEQGNPNSPRRRRGDGWRTHGRTDSIRHPIRWTAQKDSSEQSSDARRFIFAARRTEPWI